MRQGTKSTLFQFFLADKTVRGAVVTTTALVNDARRAQKTGPLETLLLGQALTAASLLSTTLKEGDSVNFRIECGGPMGGLSVDTNALGDVRGFIKNNPIDISEIKDPNINLVIGPGFLTVTRFNQTGKEPFSGQVEMPYGSIAKDFAYYYLTSEQTQTAFCLSINFDPAGKLKPSGGFYLQVLPGADESILEKLENAIADADAINTLFSAGTPSKQLIETLFSGFDLQWIGEKETSFFCPCSKDGFTAFLKAMSGDQLQNFAEEGPYPFEVRCQNCGSVFVYSQEELALLYQSKLEGK